MTHDQERIFFEAQFEEYSALATRVAFGVMRTHADAEDIAQLAFIRAHRELSSLRDPLKFRAWLVRIVRRLALNSRRAARRRSVYEDGFARQSDRYCRAEVVVEKDGCTHIRSLINDLPAGQRLAIVLAGVEGHTIREVAEFLRVPEGTVKTWLFRGRRHLRERLRSEARSAFSVRLAPTSPTGT